MEKFLKFFFITLLVLCLLSGTLVAQEQEKQGQVTIPLDQFLKLMNSGNKPAAPAEPPPPVNLVFGTSDLSITAEKDALRVECKAVFSIFQYGWTEISLLSSQAALSEVKINGDDMPVYIKDGKYTVLYRSAGKHTLTLTYLVSAHRAGNTTTAQLLLPPSSSSNVKIVIPSSGINFQVTPSMGGNIIEEEKRTIYKGTIPAGEQVQVSWSLSPTSSNNNSTAQVNVKPRIYAQVYNLVSVSVGAVQITSSVNLSILKGQTDNVSFLMPKDVEVLDVKSDKLQTWSMEDGKENKKLTAVFTEKVEGSQQITVTYEKPLKEINSTWSISVLQVMDAEQDKGFIACEAKTSLEMQKKEEQDINRIDMKELPSALVDMASTPVILAYRYYKHPFVLSIETQKHEELPVLSATIDTAQAITFVNDDGVALTRVIYQMKNNVKQYLQIKLPEGSEIMNAFVAGAPVKPVKGSDKDNTIALIPLRKSESGGNAGLNSFAIEVTYKSKSGSFSFLGSKRENLPACDVQVSQYYWTIYMPEDNRVFSFGGNMKQGGSMAPPVSTVVSQTRSEESYDKDIAKKIAPSGSGGVAPSVALEKTKQKELQQNMIQNFANTSVADNNGRVSGVLPVQIYIPQSNQVFTFKKLLVDKESPFISANYIGNSFVTFLYWIFLIVTFYMVIMLQRQKISRYNLLPLVILIIVSILIGKKLSDIFSATMTGVFLGLVYLLITYVIRYRDHMRKIPWTKPLNTDFTTDKNI